MDPIVKSHAKKLWKQYFSHIFLQCSECAIQRHKKEGCSYVVMLPWPGMVFSVVIYSNRKTFSLGSQKNRKK